MRQAATTGRGNDFRGAFAGTAGDEALKAYLVFGALLLVLLAIAGQLAFRELNLQVLAEGLDLGRREARTIADTVTLVGDDERGIDFSRIRLHRRKLMRNIQARIETRVFIHYVEVVDRFGVRQLFVPNPGFERVRPDSVYDLSVPSGWPGAEAQVVSVPLRNAEGTVRLAVASGPILDQLAELQSSLKKKVVLAGGAAVAVLVLGFFYVLYLLRKNRRLEHARQSAARASYVGLLASGLAHEIRNPLNAMNMNLQMLHEELAGLPGLDSSECGELLESTKSEIKRLEALVNNFLAFARPSQPRFEPRDLNSVVGGVVRFLDADFRQRGLGLVTDFEPLLPEVEVDETQLKQALMNLLVNARQVLEPGGRVVVRTRAGSRGDVVIDIQDDGPGVAEELRDRVFEVFYSNRGGGTGLGLPIARQIVEQHGGTIEMETAAGRGTTFRIHLPRRHAGAEVPREAAEARR